MPQRSQVMLASLKTPSSNPSLEIMLQHEARQTVKIFCGLPMSRNIHLASEMPAPSTRNFKHQQLQASATSSIRNFKHQQHQVSAFPNTKIQRHQAPANVAGWRKRRASKEKQKKKEKRCGVGYDSVRAEYVFESGQRDWRALEVLACKGLSCRGRLRLSGMEILVAKQRKNCQHERAMLT